ncbi:uncharacterized protein [Primulina eburnea]|uniref:uncharacterized protein n=1 Tax=Primulina eburnea TaxID=1245227 RepID=UPI003C6CC17A
MAGRPPRHNRNPRGDNQNENPPPPPPHRVNLSQEDMMAIATIVAATLKWWETVSPSLAEVEEITWQIFKREFLKQYYPAEFRLQKLNESENFRQSPDMMVMEYTSRFNDLGTYVPTIMSDETLKMHRFKKGLNSRIQSALAVFKPSSFSDLMGAAMSTETDIKRREEENKNKRPLNSQSMQNGPKFKKPNYLGGSFKGNFNNASITEGKWCEACRQKHVGECYRKTGACFKCGKMGHRIRDCPDNKDKGTRPSKQQENKTNARVYAVTQEEADNSNEVVAGTILLNKMSAYALFDCGDTHSFVSRRSAKKLKLEHDILSEPLRVATLASKTIETRKVYRNCKICISKQTFEVELIQLNMVEFDMILGMDWLVKNHAIVDCQKNEIRLQTPTKEEVLFHGKSKEIKFLLSASQAWKAIKGGKEIYLAVINEIKEEEVPKLEDIPIVQEFPDVFPEELPGIKGATPRIAG